MAQIPVTARTRRVGDGASAILSPLDKELPQMRGRLGTPAGFLHSQSGFDLSNGKFVVFPARLGEFEHAVDAAEERPLDLRGYLYSNITLIGRAFLCLRVDLFS